MMMMMMVVVEVMVMVMMMMMTVMMVLLLMVVALLMMIRSPLQSLIHAGPNNADDHRRFRAHGVAFEPVRHEEYGSVTVVTDRYGNKWDLIQPPAPGP
jgi:hypothetical protein